MGNAADFALPNVVYRFGLFVLDAGAGTLMRNGARVKLQDQPFRLLTLLAQKPGQIVSREEIQRSLWPENTFVEFDKSLGVAVVKVREALADDAANPRFIETIPRRGYRFIAPIAVTDAARAPLPGGEQNGAGSRPVLANGSAISESNPPRSRWVWQIPSLLLAVALVGFGIYEFHSRRHSAAEASVTAVPVAKVHLRRSVAVLGFRNLPGRAQEEWLSTAFSEMLSTELAAGGELRLVSGEDVARAKRELSLAEEDTLAKPTLQRLHTNPGADLVVLGSYTLLPRDGKNRIRLDVRLQDTGSGETIAEEAFTGNEDNLFELASQAGVRLRENLGLSLSLATATGTTRVTLPANQLAVRLYTEGRDKLWSFDPVAAHNLLAKAVAADPNYPLAHSDLSRAWSLLGYEANARKEAKRALDLSQQLPQEDALIIQGWYYQSIHENAKAVEAYQVLFNMFPDSLDYGLRLAGVQLNVKPTDALRTLAILKNLPSPLGEDPRIDLIEASAWVDQDLQKARAAAERAISKGNAEGSPLIVARGYGFLCQQGSTYGASFDRAIRECEKARSSYIAAGDKNNAARTLNDFAGLYYQQGDLAKAESMWSEAITDFRRVGDSEGLAAAANNLGDSFILQGKLNEARKLLQQAMSGYQAIDDKDGVARALVDLAEISKQQGDLMAAEDKYKRAVAVASEFDDKSASAYALAGLGDVLTDQGDLAAARKFYNEALELRKQVGENQTIAETQMALAELSIDEGHGAEVEGEIRQCKERFHQQQQLDDELAASVVLSEVLRAQSKQTESQTELAESRSLVEKTQNRLLGMRYRLESVRALLSTNQAESLRYPLEQILQESSRLGFAELKLETMFTHAELEKRTGHDGAARAQLAALRIAARSKGFVLIANKTMAVTTLPSTD